MSTTKNAAVFAAIKKAQLSAVIESNTESFCNLGGPKDICVVSSRISSRILNAEMTEAVASPHRIKVNKLHALSKSLVP